MIAILEVDQIFRYKMKILKNALKFGTGIVSAVYCCRAACDACCGGSEDDDPDATVIYDPVKMGSNPKETEAVEAVEAVEAEDEPAETGNDLDDIELDKTESDASTLGKFKMYDYSEFFVFQVLFIIFRRRPFDIKRRVCESFWRKRFLSTIQLNILEFFPAFKLNADGNSKLIEYILPLLTSIKQELPPQATKN